MPPAPESPELIAAQQRIAELELGLLEARERLHDVDLASIERQSAINEVLRAVSVAAFDLEGVLAIVIGTATKLCHAMYGVIYLLDEGMLRFAAAAGATDEHIQRERENPEPLTRGSAAGRAVTSGAAVSIADVLEDAEYERAEGQREIGFRSLLGVPIRNEDRIIGAMTLARNDVRPFSQAEILLVTAFADQAAIAIENTRLVKTIERQRSELSRFLSPQVAALVSSPQGEQLLAGHRRQATAVFCDLRDFTAFAEMAEPEELFAVLRDHHAAMGALIVAYGGTLEHFAGDGLLVFFNDPVPQDDHVVRAVRMAEAMRTRFGELAVGWRKRGYELGFGVGIATGYVTLGRIGFEGRYDYGAIGTAVILAARLCAEAKAGQILLSQRVHAVIEDEVEAEPIGELQLKGFSRPVPAVNLLRFRAAGWNPPANEA
ncbi:MAG: adenylate/guanylate cyclase domain-containing protein [Candidatus Limnocylindrales bacterium]